ncbi:MAG TPA: M28 family peptidase [Vicinamibacterales bacterium]|nr:M28 family peptidase [Vicinamibacterales bacterium]
MPIRTLVVALALVGPIVHAQESVLPREVRAAADGISSAQLAKELAFLSSDELQGRNTPSPGFDKAAAYVADRLKQAGVTPFGDDGTFFQRYEMHESRVDVDAAWVEIGGERFRFGDDFVMRSFAAPLAGELPLVYVGHGWTVQDSEINPYAGLDVRGKLVVAHGGRALPTGASVEQIGRVIVGASAPLAEAARLGAAGVVFIGQSSPRASQEAARNQNTARRELEPPVPSAYAAPSVTSIVLASSATEALFAGERADSGEIIERGEKGDYPASFQFAKSVTLNVPATQTVVHRPYNVVALIEGSDPALRDEYVTVEAHLDGAVGSRAIDGDAVYNSADDNATGSAAALLIAEQMMRAPRPKRSLVFIWDSGEEQGLWGTRYFVSRPPVSEGKVVAHFNIDMIGATRAPGTADASETRVTGPNEVYLIGPGVLSARADALLERVNRQYLNLRFNRDHDRADSEFFYPRTDAGPFLERGILTIGFTTGIHDRYHLPSDEARFLDPKKMEAIARTALASIWAIADSPERPRIDKPVPASVPRWGQVLH